MSTGLCTVNGQYCAKSLGTSDALFKKRKKNFYIQT